MKVRSIDERLPAILHATNSHVAGPGKQHSDQEINPSTRPISGAKVLDGRRALGDGVIPELLKLYVHARAFHIRREPQVELTHCSAMRMRASARGF